MQLTNVPHTRITRYFAAILLSITISNILYAQTNFISPYKPLKDDSLKLSSALSELEARYKSETGKLNGEYKKQVADLYKERFNRIKELFTNKELVATAMVQDYLRLLTNEIVSKNAELQSIPVSFFFSRTFIPNAACWGNGLIVFNAGLFTKLANESQVAFVLCHELAHLYLNHNNNHIDKYVATMYSEETQKELKRIKSSSYNKRTSWEGLVREINFDNRRHRRDKETEADSLGFVFMQRTRFALPEALSCLGLLDSIDTDHFNTERFLKEQFHHDAYPFRAAWLQKEEGLLGGHATLIKDSKLEDSLKTHPDCSKRILALQPKVEKIQVANNPVNVINKETFQQLRELFSYEMLTHAYTSKQYSRCLFIGLQMLEAKPNDPYIIGIIGKTWNGIYLAQKNHTLNKVIDLPAPGCAVNYNLLLQFLQNLLLKDIAGINYYFLQKYAQAASSCTAYTEAWADAKKIFEPTTTR